MKSVTVTADEFVVMIDALDVARVNYSMAFRDTALSAAARAIASKRVDAIQALIRKINREAK